MIGNSIAGSEKIGYKFAGTDCQNENPSENVRNNEVNNNAFRTGMFHLFTINNPATSLKKRCDERCNLQTAYGYA